MKHLYDGLELLRRPRLIGARLVRPHRVLSSDPVDGGLREDLEGVFNHRSCDEDDAEHEFFSAAGGDAARYKRIVCRRYGLAPGRCILLGTGARMENASVRCEGADDLHVATVVTAGVSNAVRAGDPASVRETAHGFEAVEGGPAPSGGTINILLFIGRELTPAALVEAVMTATEAKAAALQDLSVRSRYGEGAATGTGTDQIAVAAGLGGARLHSAGTHTALGACIGRVVRCGVLEALARQEGLSPPAARRAGRV